MTKKIVILGRGTAGALSAAYLTKAMPHEEIEWHYDPSIPPQAVGEGSGIDLPSVLLNTLDFNYCTDLKEVDGSFKAGIYKEGWGTKNDPFFHSFIAPGVAIHFNALKFQDFVLNKLRNNVKVVEHNVTSDQIDADFIMDCSGKPSSLEKFNVAEGISVNSVTVNQCYWDLPRFPGPLS